MSKHRAPGARWDSAHETAQFLAEVAVNSALEQHGHNPRHPMDVAETMIAAIDSTVEAIETMAVRSRP